MIDFDSAKLRVETAARNVARLFPDFTSTGDITQHLWVWILENQGTVERYQEEADGDRKLSFVMNQKATAFAQSEKANALGYSIDDLASYGVRTLREVLKDAYDYEDWQSFGDQSD